MFTSESYSLKRSGPASIVPVPLKRRKTEGTANSQSPSIPAIKKELSPSPSLTAPRTSGTKCVNLPDACQKSNLAWKENREKWVAAETKILIELGLQIVKRIVRDDGLAIDWQSNVPVDPVTLQPPPPGPSEAVSPPHDLSIIHFKPTDPLGHALRDQTAVACQLAPSPPPPPVQLLKERSLCSPRRDVSPIANGDDGPNIAVVGAALLKEHPLSILGETSVSGGQTEHRKLLPPGLRGRRTNQKRKDYLNSQIEYVEGYTGEKYVGHRYEGNYVVITVGRKRKPSNWTVPQTKQMEHQQGVVERREGNRRHDHWSSSQSGRQPRGNQWRGLSDEHGGATPQNGTAFGSQNHGQLPQQDEHASTGGGYQYHAHHTPGYSGIHVPAIHKRDWMPRTPEDAAPSSSKPSVCSMSSEDRHIFVDTRCRTNTPEQVAIPLFPDTEIPQPPESRPTVEVGSDPCSPQHPLEGLTSPQEPSALELQADEDEAHLQIESLNINVDIPISLDEAGQKGDVTERGLAFLRQFMHTFDTDRHSLVEAYSPNASLILTDDFTTLLMGGHSPYTVTTIGPDAIVKTLQCIDSEVHHSSTFSHTVATLSDMDPGGLVMTCQGMLLPRQAGQARYIFFSRILVLMKNRGPNQVNWPFQIVSDNLALRRQRR